MSGESPNQNSNTNSKRKYCIFPINISSVCTPQQRQQQLQQLLQEQQQQQQQPLQQISYNTPTTSAHNSRNPSTQNITDSSNVGGTRISDCRPSAVENLTPYVSALSSSQVQLNIVQQQGQQMEQYNNAMTSNTSLSDSAKINCKLNEIFIKRLKDIDCNAEGDTDLKLVTYQEWVDMLLKINDAIINNMTELESEVAQRLELIQSKLHENPNYQCPPNESAKYRRDIARLIKLIQKGYHCDDWDMQNCQFETLTPSEVLMVCEKQCTSAEGNNTQSQQPSSAQKNQLSLKMKALAVEVAQKHDEICELKKQICCLEDEIQNAQGKIQLKDDVIKELRCDLKSSSAKEQEKNEAYRKLDFIRRQLIDLEATPSDSGKTQCECDSGFSSKSENDQDVKILDGVRKRMKKLNDSNFELKKKLQQQEIEKNEMESKLQSEKVFVQRNSETLKQVADLLCNMSGKQFSYNDIYNQQCNQNPFCEAILELEKSRLQHEEQLLQKMDQMEATIFSYEKELQVAEQHLANPPMANDIVKTSTTKTVILQQDTVQQQQQQQQQQREPRPCQQQQQQPVDNRHQGNRDSNNNNANNRKKQCNTTTATTPTTSNTNVKDNSNAAWNW